MSIYNYDEYTKEMIINHGDDVGSYPISPLDYQLENSLIKIREYLQSDKPVIITRIGGTDFDFLLDYVKRKKNGRLMPLFNNFCKGNNLLYEFNGYFDTTDSMEEEIDNLTEYAEICLESYKNSDLIQVANGSVLDNMNFVYYPGNRLKKSSSKRDINLSKLFNRELNYIIHPMEYINYITYKKNNFIKTIFPLFEGKTILVISPFIEDIEKQYKIKDKLYTFGPYQNFIYPNFTLKTLKTPITYSKYTERKNINYMGYKNWHECLSDIKNKLKDIEFDIALLGCGSYTLPLLNDIKNRGKHAIYCGGVLQIFFGILGSRYSYLEESGICNEHWIYPEISKADVSTHDLKLYNEFDGIFAYTKKIK